MKIKQAVPPALRTYPPLRGGSRSLPLSTMGGKRKPGARNTSGQHRPGARAAQNKAGAERLKAAIVRVNAGGGSAADQRLVASRRKAGAKSNLKEAAKAKAKAVAAWKASGGQLGTQEDVAKGLEVAKGFIKVCQAARI